MTKITTKADILTQLAMLRRMAATIDNPMTRSEAAATVDAVSNAIGELVPDVTFSHEQLQSDYTSVRGTLANERKMRMSVFSNNPPKQREKVAEIDRAGKALGRMAQALSLQVPSVVANAEPEPQQAALISVPGREVMA